MNFTTFVEDNNLLLLEANYSYSIPSDKELMMYDFYMMFHWLDTLDYSVGEPKADMMGNVAKLGTMRMGLRDKTKESFDHIKEQILEYLKEEMLEGSFYAIACEMRHLKDRSTNMDKLKNRQNFSEKDEQIINTFFKYMEKYMVIYASDKLKHGELKRHKAKMNFKFGTFRKTKEGNTSDYSYQASYAAAKKTLLKENIKREDFAGLAVRCFDRKYMDWAGSYGGDPWKSIAEAHTSLHNANTQFKKILYIDNVYHQQHNTDTMFNKVSEYYKNSGGYGWIKNALNFKADNKEPYELIRKIMTLNKGIKRGVDKMYIEMLKAAGKESYQEYFKIGPPEPKVKTEFPDESMKATLKKEVEKKKESGLVPDLSGLLDDTDFDSGMKNAVSTIKSIDDLPEKLQNFLKMRDWVALKEEGKTIYPKIYNDAKQTYIGKGWENRHGTGIKQHINFILDKAGYDGTNPVKLQMNVEGSDYLETGTKAGTVTHRNYFMPNKQWNSIFGVLLNANGTKTKPLAKGKVGLNVFQQIQEYAKEGEEKLKSVYEAGYVFVGPGTNKDKPLCDVINEFLGITDDGSNNPSSFMYLIPDAEFGTDKFNIDEFATKVNEQWETHGKNAFYQFYVSGSEPTVGYFVKKAKWEELQEKYDKLPESKKKAPSKKMDLNIDMEKVDNPALKALFAAVQEGPNRFPKACDPTKGKFVYVGEYRPDLMPQNPIAIRKMMADAVMENEISNNSLNFPIGITKPKNGSREELLSYYNNIDNKMAHGSVYSDYDRGSGSSEGYDYFYEAGKWKIFMTQYEEIVKMLGEPQERELSKIGLSNKENQGLLKIIKKNDSDLSKDTNLGQLKEWELETPIVSLVFKRGTVIDLDELVKYFNNNSAYDYNRYHYAFNKLMATGIENATHFYKSTVEKYKAEGETKMVVHSIVPHQYGKVSIFSIIENPTRKGLVQFTISTGDFVKNCLEMLTAQAYSVTYKTDLILKLQSLTENTLSMEQYANVMFSAFSLYALSTVGSYNTEINSVKFRLSKEIQETNPQFKKYYSSARAGQKAYEKDSNTNTSINSVVFGYMGNQTDLKYHEKPHYIESLIPVGVYKKGNKKGYLYIKKLKNKPLDSYDYASNDYLGTNPAKEAGFVFSGIPLKEIDINEDNPNDFFSTGDTNTINSKDAIHTGFYDGGKGIVFIKDHSVSKNGVDNLPGLKIMMMNKDGEFSMKMKSFEKEKEKIKFLDNIAVKMQGKQPTYNNALYGLVYHSEEKVRNRTWGIINEFFKKKPNWEMPGSKGATYIKLLPDKPLDKKSGYDKKYMNSLQVTMGYVEKGQANANSKPYEYSVQSLDSMVNQIFNRGIILLTDVSKLGKMDEIYKKTKDLDYESLVGRKDAYGNSKNYKKHIHNPEYGDADDPTHTPLHTDQKTLPRFKDFDKTRREKENEDPDNPTPQPTPPVDKKGVRGKNME